MRSARRLPMLAALLLAAGSTAAHAQLNFTASSPSELRDLGRSLLAEYVAETGRDLNPVWRRDVAMILDSVKTAANYTAHPVTWDIISDSSMNAAALPGGVMVINVGLPIFCTEVGESRGRGSAAAARRAYVGCMAAVIGHEFGHLALAHTDSIGTMIQRRQEIDARRDHASGIEEEVADSILMRHLRLERDQELAADEAGALYIMRAGWEIQDAIDLFVAMDSTDRASRHWRGDLTWLRGHPRSAERAALLEARRAQLKLLQRDFDDALALIDHNVMPDSALAMLDRVLQDLPRLPAALHARAVLLGREWLATASAADLKVRPTLPAYDAQFMSSIKGGDATALRAAREAFARALAVEAHPYTLANLAVLDAYAGDATLARQRAELAAERLPDDPNVQNNLGVVHFLAGRWKEAHAAFHLAEDLEDDDLTAAVAFNHARSALAMGDTAAARRLINRYVAFDRSSAWGREALAMQRQVSGTGAVATQSSDRPTPAAATRPPLIGGVRLGMPASQVLQALGKPDESADTELGIVWAYESRGMTLVVHPSQGVVLVLLESPSAGDVLGLRVGDTVERALNLLGPAAERERDADGSGEMLSFDRGNWMISVGASDGYVRALGVVTPDR